MTLSKSIKHTLLISASVLMMASVGAPASNMTQASAKTKSHPTKVLHHHRHGRHSKLENAINRELAKKNKKSKKSHKIHKHHNKHYAKKHHSKHHKSYRHHKHARKHYRKHGKKHYRHHHHAYKHHKSIYSYHTHGKHYYDPLGRTIRRHILKWHHKAMNGKSSEYRDGFYNGASDNNNTPSKQPSVNMHKVDYHNGISSNYQLGWIDGYVNGNYNDYFKPSHDTKIRLYNDAIKAYNKITDYGAQPAAASSVSNWPYVTLGEAEG